MFKKGKALGTGQYGATNGNNNDWEDQSILKLGLNLSGQKKLNL